MGDRVPAATAPGLSRNHWRELLLASAVLITSRSIASWLVHRSGFHALSDDDFARITIAQTFAREPHLDPTGTSWLPLPFWAEGAAMMLFGRSLLVAHAFAAAMTALCCVVLYSAARIAGVSARAALLSGLLCSLMPVALLVGAAPIPDFGVAALCASSLLLLRARNPHWRIASGALLLAASLCRYEPWPAALAVALFALVPQADKTKPNPTLPIRWISCSLALAGPCLWIAWNRYAHGDALHFHARVSAFRSALGVASGGWRALAAGYPSALAADAPALFAVGLIALGALRSPTAIKLWVRPLASALVVLASLMIADAAGGAPTHHPERALLAVGFVAWTAGVDLSDQALFKANDRRRSVLLAVAAFVAILAFGAVRLNSILGGYGVDRDSEVRVGEWLRANTRPDERVLIDPVDYGYFAIIAASAAPERMLLSRSLDPRAARISSPFASEPELRARMVQDRVTWLVANRSNTLRAAADVRSTIGSWEIGRAN